MFTISLYIFDLSINLVFLLPFIPRMPSDMSPSAGTRANTRDVNTDSHVMVDLYDPKHGVKMGVPNGNCDDAKVNY